jgi:hypothetical protein
MKKNETMAETLKRAMRESDESICSICRNTGITESRLFDFLKGRFDLSLRNANKVMNHLQLELRAKKKK